MANINRTARQTRLVPLRIVQLCFFLVVISHNVVLVRAESDVAESTENEKETDEEQPAEVTPKPTKPPKVEKDWKDLMMECFNDMKLADTNADNTLTDHEYYDFCNRYGNRIFVTKNIVQKQHFWQLEELFQELVLENPFGDAYKEGVSIYGARVITREGMDERESWFLQKICNQSEKVLRKIGPKQAVADRAKEKCDLHENKIKYFGTKPPEPEPEPQVEESSISNSNSTDDDLEVMEGTIEGTLEGNDTVILETFHDIEDNTWVQEEFENGTKIEIWSNETSEEMDDDLTFVYGNPYESLMDTLTGLFGFGGAAEEEVEAEEEGEERRYLRYADNNHNMDEDTVNMDEDSVTIDEDSVIVDKDTVNIDEDSSDLAAGEGDANSEFPFYSSQVLK